MSKPFYFRIGFCTVILAGCLAWAQATSRNQRVLRILPLGDSITESAAGQHSYRFYLQAALRNLGVTYDFVGSLRGVHGGLPADTAFDADHEGHWGWRADEVLVQLPLWLSAAKPDITLIHLGTNDLFQGEDAKSTLADIQKMVSELRTTNNSMRIVVAQILPWKGGEALPDRLRFNEELAKWVIQIDPQGKTLRVADCSSGFEPTQDTWDGYHPNAQGEKKMAARWLAALKPMLKSEELSPQ